MFPQLAFSSTTYKRRHDNQQSDNQQNDFIRDTL
jgi:hypothetical protein